MSCLRKTRREGGRHVIQYVGGLSLLQTTPMNKVVCPLCGRPGHKTKNSKYCLYHDKPLPNSSHPPVSMGLSLPAAAMPNQMPIQHIALPLGSPGSIEQPAAGPLPVFGGLPAPSAMARPPEPSPAAPREEGLDANNKDRNSKLHFTPFIDIVMCKEGLCVCLLWYDIAC